MQVDWIYHVPLAELRFENDIVGFMAVAYSNAYGSSGCLMPIWRDGYIGNFEKHSEEKDFFYDRLEQFNFPSDKEVRRIEIFELEGKFNGMKFYDEHQNCLGQLCETEFGALYQMDLANVMSVCTTLVIELKAGERIIGCKYFKDKFNEAESYYHFIIGKRNTN